METKEVNLTKEEALALALKTIETEFQETGIDIVLSMLGWDDQVCVYCSPNGQHEAEIYSDFQLNGLGTENVTLKLPGDEKDGLHILFHWDMDDLVEEHFEISRK